MIEDHDVEPAAGADVVVASAAPVLPLPDLGTAPLFPHLLRVVEATRALAVVLQSKVTVLDCQCEKEFMIFSRYISKK